MKKSWWILALWISLSVGLLSVAYGQEENPTLNYPHFNRLLYAYGGDDDEECNTLDVLLQDESELLAIEKHTLPFDSQKLSFDTLQFNKESNVFYASASAYWNNLPLLDNGCYLFAVEDDGLMGKKFDEDTADDSTDEQIDDDTAGIALKFGEILNYEFKNYGIESIDENFLKIGEYKINSEGTNYFDNYIVGTGGTNSQLEYVFEGEDEWVGNADNNVLFCDDVRTSSAVSYLCGQKEFSVKKEGEDVSANRAVWLACSSESVGQVVKVKTSDGKLQSFKCASAVSYVTWQQLSCGNEDCDASEDACAVGGTYDWEGEVQGKSCCGDDKNDYGYISDDGEYLCYNDNPDDLKKGNWMWLAANQPSPKGKFEILSLKQSTFFYGKITYDVISNADKLTYDVISNADKWVECKPPAFFKPVESGGPNELEVYGPESNNANRFYCAQYGGSYNWLECKGADDKFVEIPTANVLNKESKKQRAAGEPTTLLIPSEKTFGGDSFAIAAGKKEDLLITDWIDATHLEFFVKFTGDPLSSKNPSSPSILLEIYAEGGKKLFSANALDYVVNTPKLEKGKWMYIRIPLTQNIVNIDYLSFKALTSNPDTEIEVKNIYLRPKDDAQFRFCSESNSAKGNIWIDTLDMNDIEKEVTGENACKDPFIWLGSQCGGDDSEYGTIGGSGIYTAYPAFTTNEYAVGDGTTTAVWNGNPLQADASAMNIEFLMGGQLGGGAYSSIFTYFCDASECTYPLRGEPTYAIRNLYPFVYDLYFVDGKGKEHLITGNIPQIFNEKGLLRAKRVPQQILFAGGKFRGCMLSSFISDKIKESFEEANFCTVSGDYFCSFEKGWSNEKTTLKQFTADGNEIVPFSEIPAEDPLTYRNTSASIVPEKNILFNADFSVTVEKGFNLIPSGWTLEGEAQVEVGGGTVRISSEDARLTSPLLVVEEGKTYRATVEANCLSGSGKLILSFVDGDTGKISEAIEETTDSSSGSTLLQSEVIAETNKIIFSLESKGTCKFSQPVFELAGKTDAPFNAEKDKSLTAASCCSPGACWNGFTCVEDMAGNALAVEKITEDVLYRCIDSQWKPMPKRWDWKFDKSGFCAEEEQCFVTNNPPADPATANATTALEGNIPNCINDGEYILDHLCQQGQWTTRTKQLALHLLNAAKKEEGDYVLYCSNYKDALVDAGYPAEGKAVEEFITGATASDSTSALPPTGGCHLNYPTSILPAEENTCANNFCVLKTGEDVLVGTTLNKLINDTEDSFLAAFGIAKKEIPAYCESDDKNSFVDCKSAQYQYNKKLNALVFTQEEPIYWCSVPIIKSIFDCPVLLSSVSFDPVSLQQDIQSATEKKIPGAKGEVSATTPAFDETYDQLYLAEAGDKKVNAIVQHPTQENGPYTLTAQYEGFKTDVCTFYENSKITISSGGTSAIPGVLGDCKNNLFALKGSKGSLAVFWPHLTGKLRGEINQ